MKIKEIELDYTEEFYFQWHLTNECNMRCRHCYHEQYNGNFLTNQELRKISIHICEVLKVWNKSGSISLTGGEPFLRKDSVFEILDIFENDENIGYIDILSNGLLIDEEIARRLGEFSKIRRIQLSLEGLEDVNDSVRGSGSFKRIVSKLSELKTAGLTTSVMMTLGRHNAHQINDLADILASLGVEAFIVDRFIPSGQSSILTDWLLSSEELKEIFQLCYKRFQERTSSRMLMYRPLMCLLNPNDKNIGAICSAGNNALTIMPDGDVLPCRRLPIKLGNILETTIFDIWYTNSVLWELRNPGNLKGRCKDCKYIPVCRGCRAMAYAMTGDYLEEDPHCWIGGTK